MKASRTTNISEEKEALELSKLGATITMQEETQLKSKRLFDPAWQEAAAAGDAEGMLAAERKILSDLRARGRNPLPVRNNAAPPAGKPDIVPSKAVGSRGDYVRDGIVYSADGKPLGKLK